MKKLIALLLTVCLLAACLPLSASAAGADVLTKGGNIKLTEDVTIPEVLSITKDTVLDLNGHTITGGSTPNENGVLLSHLLIIAEGVTFSAKNGTFSEVLISNRGTINSLTDLTITTKQQGGGGLFFNKSVIHEIKRCSLSGPGTIQNSGTLDLLDNCDIYTSLDKYGTAYSENSTNSATGKVKAAHIVHCRIYGMSSAYSDSGSKQSPCVIEDSILVGGRNGGIHCYSAGANFTVKNSVVICTRPESDGYGTAVAVVVSGNIKPPRIEGCTLIAAEGACGSVIWKDNPNPDTTNGLGKVPEFVSNADMDSKTQFLSLSSVNWRSYYDAWKMEDKPAEDEEEKPEETPAVSTDFKDVPAKAYYAPAVAWAVENKITSGTGGGKFSPAKPCSRAEAVTFLWRAAGCPEPTSSAVSFSDVKSNTYYTKAVAWAVEKGITSGTGGGKFSPDKSCSRSEIVAFLYRAEGSPAVSGGASFSDVPEKSFYTDAVAWAVANEITSGTGGGKFSPVNRCDRSQIVTFLYRYST